MDDTERHAERAEAAAQTAAVDVVRTDHVLEEWRRVLNEQEEIVRKNGFGAALTKIMRAPARRSAA